jgi:hypothetical protein
MFMSASSYVLNGGTTAANVEHHYTVFGRNRDLSCFEKWNPVMNIGLPLFKIPIIFKVYPGKL